MTKSELIQFKDIFTMCTNKNTVSLGMKLLDKFVKENKFQKMIYHEWCIGYTIFNPVMKHNINFIFRSKIDSEYRSITFTWGHSFIFEIYTYDPRVYLAKDEYINRFLDVLNNCINEL